MERVKQKNFVFRKGYLAHPSIGDCREKHWECLPSHGAYQPSSFSCKAAAEDSHLPYHINPFCSLHLNTALHGRCLEFFLVLLIQANTTDTDLEAFLSLIIPCLITEQETSATMDKLSTENQCMALKWATDFSLPLSNSPLQLTL